MCSLSKYCCLGFFLIRVCARAKRCTPTITLIQGKVTSLNGSDGSRREGRWDAGQTQNPLSVSHSCLSSLCSGEEQYSTQRLSDGGVRGGLKENEREG